MNLLYILSLRKKEVSSAGEVNEAEEWLDRFTEKHDRLMGQRERYEIAYLHRFYR